MRLGLFLRGWQGAATLRAVMETDTHVAFVATAEDRAMLDDGHAAIVELADEAGIPVHYPNPVLRGQTRPPTEHLTHSLAAGWRSMLTTPNLVVLHDSILPRYRGFSPLVAAMLNGDRRIGVSAILATPADDSPDVGPIVDQVSVDVSYPARVADVIAQLAPVYADMTGRLLERWPSEGTPQNDQNATYSPWRDRDDYLLDWTRSAAEVHRMVLALGPPYPGALTRLSGATVRVTEATPMDDDVVIEDRLRHIGKTVRIDGGLPVVICGLGLLRVDKTEPLHGTQKLPPATLRRRFG